MCIITFVVTKNLCIKMAGKYHVLVRTLHYNMKNTEGDKATFPDLIMKFRKVAVL